MKKILLLMALFAAIYSAEAYQAVQFIENAGQYADKSLSETKILYAADLGRDHLYIYLDKMLISSAKQLGNDVVEKYNIMLSFLGSNLNAEVRALHKSATRNNFYVSSGSFVGVPSYEEILIENIYPGIDFRIYTNDNSELEYDFIVSPGADPDKIKIKIDDANISAQSDGSLILANALSNLKKKAPYSYQQSDGLRRTVQSEFVIKDNIISFNTADYDRTKSLIIDPVMNVWSTYYGGSNIDFAADLKADSDNNVYITGYTNSSNLTVTVNQDTLAGDFDAFVKKFNADGSTAWATYFGGSGVDQAYGLDVDDSGYVYITGTTKSSDLFANVNQTVKAANNDAFILKLNPDGTSNWCTFWGGNDLDHGKDIALDPQRNIIVYGETKSNNLFVTVNQTALAGLQDAFALKLNNAGATLWCTYYGGSDNDYSTDLCTDNNGNIYINGYTRSTNLFVNVNQLAKGADDDAYILKLNSNGTTNWATYYGGNADDQSGGIVTDDSGNVYATGWTASTNLPMTINQIAKGAFQDSYVLKLNSNGTTNWATYFGANGSDLGNAIVLDNRNNVYIAGTTSSVDLPATVYQTSKSTGNDAFIAKFFSNGTNAWATYYGGNSGDGAYGLDGDGMENGNLFVAGMSSSTDLDVNTNQTVYGGGNTDAFVITLGEALAVTNVSNSLCSGEIIDIPFVANENFAQDNTFTAQLSNKNGSFSLPTAVGNLSGNSSGIIEGQIPEDIEFGTAYRIRVISSNPPITGQANSENITINITPTSEITSGDAEVCSNSPFVYTRPSSTFTEWEWTPTGGSITASTDSTVEILWGDPGDASLSLTETDPLTGCSSTYILPVAILENPAPEIIDPLTEVCPGRFETYQTNPNPFAEYEWSVEGGEIDGASDSVYADVVWGYQSSGTLTLIETNLNTGCTDSTKVFVDIIPMDEPEISEGDFTVCEGTAEWYTTNPSSTFTEITWDAVGGEMISSPNDTTVQILWDSAGTGKLYLSIYDPETGCTSETEKEITINLMPEPMIFGDTTFCFNSIAEFSAPSSTFSTYEWSVEGGTLISSSTFTTIEVEWGESSLSRVILTETMNETGCSKSVEKIIHLRAQPKATISGDTATFQGYFETYTGPSVSYYKFQWYVLGGEITSTGYNNITVNWTNQGPGFVALAVTDTIGGCSDSTFIQVNVGVKPPPDVMGPFRVCEFTIHEYTTVDDPAYSLKWEVDGGLIQTGETEPTVRIGWLVAGVGELRLIQTIKSSQLKDTATHEIIIDTIPPTPVITQVDEALVADTDTNYINVWYRDNEEIIGENTNYYYPSEPGSYTVKVVDSRGCESEISDPFIYTSIEEISLSGEFDLYPNPADGSLQFINPTEDKICRAEIHSLAGILMLSTELQPGTNIVNTDLLPSGSYFVRIFAGDRIISKKLMIKH